MTTTVPLELTTDRWSSTMQPTATLVEDPANGPR